MGPGADVEHAVDQLGADRRLVDSRPLTGGVSADVFLLEVTAPPGPSGATDQALQPVVFRQHRSGGENQRRVTQLEYGLLTELHRVGFPVPEPILHHPGDPRAGPYLLMAFVDGSTDVAAPELPRALDQLADSLAALHRIDAATLTVPELAAIENPSTEAGQYLPDDPVGQRIATALAALPEDWQGNPPRLLHCDYWPGNVIWRNGTLAAVIDWEDACLGDPLADLATARIELHCAYGPEATARFTERYLAAARTADATITAAALPVWEVYSAAAALATMHGWGLEPEVEEQRRARTRACLERAADELDRLASG